MPPFVPQLESCFRRSNPKTAAEQRKKHQPQSKTYLWSRNWQRGSSLVLQSGGVSEELIAHQLSRINRTSPASNLFAEKKTKLPSQGELLLFFRSAAEEELWPRLFAHLFQFGSGNESTVSDYHCSSAPPPQLPRNSCRGGGSDQKKPSKRWKAGLDQSNPSSFKLKSKSILLQDKKFSWHWTSCCWSTRNAGVGQVN